MYLNTYRIYNYEQFNDVSISGCELNFHYHPHFIHNLHLEQSYAFISTLNKDTDIFLARTPSNKIKTRLQLSLDTYNLPFGLNSLSVYHLYSFAQQNVVLYESSTSAYGVWNIELFFNLVKKLSFNFGVNNVFNKEYVPHLSRIKEVAQGVPDPGRSINLSLKYDF